MCAGDWPGEAPQKTQIVIFLLACVGAMVKFVSEKYKKRLWCWQGKSMIQKWDGMSWGTAPNYEYASG